jgi:hypothetical protein
VSIVRPDTQYVRITRKNQKGDDDAERIAKGPVCLNFPTEEVENAIVTWFDDRLPARNIDRPYRDTVVQELANIRHRLLTHENQRISKAR